ncbi:MAG: TIM barrel protein [Eubacteriales bacterium]|nr:TIM barrel protein [Eubacteriales bacterium]
MNRIHPSLHLLEIFMPVADNETFLTGLLQECTEIPFYRGFELPVISQKQNQNVVRSLAESGYQITQWASPKITGAGYNLSSTEPELRKRSAEYAIELMKTAAESGTTNVGLPSGDDPGDLIREEAKKALSESYHEISEAAAKYPGLHLTLEPLDRYVHKKQLMGPIREVTEWFAKLKKECPNFYLHWDSAHEALATDISLMESMELALPYMAQFHICNCINDPSNPCYGDHHMELGAAPEYKNWGYLNVEIAAQMLRKAAEQTPPEGVAHYHAAVEVRTHMGDDMWKREREIREFLMAAFDRAGLEYEK